MGRLKLGLIIGANVVVALILGVLIAGLLLPKEHHASRTLVTKQSQQAIWDVIDDHANEALWRGDIANVKPLRPRSGMAVWQENYKDGNRVTLLTREYQPPTRIVRELTDLEGPFRGRWEIDITPTPEGSNVTITEVGEVSNPFYRFASKYVIGHTTFMERYLSNLARKFGEEPRFTQ